MVNINIIPLSLLFVVFFLSGCQAGEVVCNEPYIHVGNDCCLDKNNNSICDTDELKNQETCEPDWDCSEWTYCSQEGTQIRTCMDLHHCGVSENKPSEERSCTPPCTPEWECSEWTTCTEEEVQTRNCTDVNDCDTSKNKPSLEQTCTPCTPEWECSGWSECGSEGTQTRTCTDLNDCGKPSDKPKETQSCEIYVVEPDDIVISGSGQEATDYFSLTKGISIFNLEHEGTSNFAAVLYSARGEYISLLVNEIGRFDGSKVVPIDSSGDYLLDISADSAWSVTIEQPRDITKNEVPVDLSGEGQEASDFIYIPNGMRKFEMSHDGTRNFAAVLYSARGEYISLLVNEIGRFDGSKAVPISDSGNYILDISADGNWEISVE